MRQICDEHNFQKQKNAVPVLQHETYLSQRNRATVTLYCYIFVYISYP